MEDTEIDDISPLLCSDNFSLLKEKYNKNGNN